MNDPASVKVTVSGFVQGVFFRAFAASKANELALSGYVRNLPDGKSVEVLAEGEREQLEKLIDHLKTGPPAARVEKVDTIWADYTSDYSRFSIYY